MAVSGRVKRPLMGGLEPASFCFPLIPHHFLDSSLIVFFLQAFFLTVFFATARPWSDLFCSR